MKDTGIMKKTNLNYTAPKMEIISIETQNCFASGAPTSFSISSNNGLSDLGECDSDWN